ncbi:MAG: glycosyltransferase [Bacteroidia bacterium]|nr:glycosyltransferase [Bacteroidia bacterium]
MKILFLSCWYPTAENPLKGIFIKNHAAAIKSAGHDIRIIAFDITTGEQMFKKQTHFFTDEHGVETHLITIKSIFYKWLYINPFFIRKQFLNYYASSLYNSFKPDIIHSNILYPCSIAGDFLSQKYKVPHIITEHWSKVDKYMRRNLLSHLGKNAYDNAAAITVVSNFLKQYIKKHIISPEKIHIVPNTVDNVCFSYKEKTLHSDKLIFSAIAHWKEPKKPELFIAALNAIQNQCSKIIILNMIGDGEKLEYIKKMKLNFTINYLGNSTKQKVAVTLQKSDFFLHASSIETFSLVTAEALATGTPVICSNVGALPELVNETSGVLTENTIEAWENAIKKALKNKFDYKSISANYGEKFKSESIGNLYSGIYYKNGVME